MAEAQNDFSDDDVVRSVREGHVRDFEILVERYKRKIVNFIHKMIFDYDEAQSLAQDTFIKVYQAIPKYNSLDNFQSFIFTIAQNTTLNYIKKQKHIQFFSSFLSPGEENNHFRAADNQYELMEKDQQDEIVSTALKKINENQRLALILKVYLDFSYQQIAEITGWSIPKIETLISRAKSNLKKQVHHILKIS
ncbi:MAG TPA: RNA polymerase sigma factor [Candidatus Kapabacteria bacterium]|nr:RNA polymerase sigma factor [Candidatus Kapabacteria bacterium]